MQAPYGTPCSDTSAVCPNINTGFGFLVNWNNLGAGHHTLKTLADGVEFARATFTVVSTRAEFLRGLSGTALAPNFPSPDLDTVLVWQESLQNFVIVGSQPHVPGGCSQRCEEHGILQISGFDDLLEFDDGSVWAVDFVDQVQVVGWFLSDEVLLCTLRADFGGSRTLINLRRSSSNLIHVSQVGGRGDPSALFPTAVMRAPAEHERL